MGDVVVRATPREAAILRAIRDLTGAGEPPTIAAISAAVEANEFQTRTSLRALHRKGLLRRTGIHVVDVAGPSVIVFTVEGTARPQGSKVGFATDDGVQLLESSGDNLRAWRRLVRDVAWLHRPPAPWDGPVIASTAFYLHRPKRPKHDWPAVEPDIDKLVRAVLDGIVEGQVLADDALVVELVASKRYAEDDRVRCEVSLTRPEDAAAGTRGGSP
ncbi:MAG: RusA family crossover junction endodeoxyribonuclease [Actinomycetota bacterium]